MLITRAHPDGKTRVFVIATLMARLNCMQKTCSCESGHVARVTLVQVEVMIPPGWRGILDYLRFQLNDRPMSEPKNITLTINLFTDTHLLKQGSHLTG